MAAPEPLTPRARVRDNQFAVLTADPVLLASLGGPTVVHEVSSLACASVRECHPSAGAALSVGGGGGLARSTDEIADSRKGLIGLVAEHAVSSVWEDLET